MIPKKIYLSKEELEGVLTGERMGSIDEPYDVMTEEYVNLKQVWHDASEEPLDKDKRILSYSEDFDYFIMAFPNHLMIDVFHISKERKYNFNGEFFDWSKIVAYFILTKWAYISDLLPKGGEQ